MKRGFDQVIGGAAVTAVFGVLWLTLHWGWWVIFPIVFGGLLPMIRGIHAMFRQRSLRSSASRTARRPSQPGQDRVQAGKEKEILRLAQQQGGILTPAVLALNSSLSIDEADQALGDLARQGIARLEVSEKGRVSYEFPDFLSPTGST